jgi:hypothetical protein
VRDPSFVHFRVSTACSLPDGACQIRDLVVAAAAAFQRDVANLRGEDPLGQAANGRGPMARI